MPQLLRNLCPATLLLAALAASALAQDYYAPQVLPYGTQPTMQVAPDGAIHLDGPYAAYSNPAYSTPAGALIGQTVIAQPSPMAMQGISGGTDGYNDSVPSQFFHRTGFYGDFLFLRPRNAEVAYALPINGPVLPVLGNEVPIGSTAVVDFDHEPAFRVGLNVCLNEGASLAGQYTFFRSEAEDAATVDPALGVLRSLVSHPLGANAATDSQDANATNEINFDLVDIDYRGVMFGCESFDGKCGNVVNYLIGGRWAMLEQEFGANFIVPGTTTVDTNIDFNGGGIRAGIEGEQHSNSTGLFVYGRGVSNLMVGEFEANYRQANSLAGVQAFTDWTAGRVVPVLDLELGAGLVGPSRHLKITGGYLISTWFNVVKTDDFIQAVQGNNFDDLSGTLTFDGLTARITWEF